ncbi:hypothetical protein SLS60_004374 [Paraconiothyrium brasiliense]|uniref:DUF202 domain-containing protein n=1 Tax=Paraconiothyrium brasiliense TaxID=300254 RepID=A0ABR3RK66_9PLEO
MPPMVNSTVPRTSQRYIQGSRTSDPESQSATHILNDTNTDSSTIQHSDSTSEEQEEERKRNTYSGLPGWLDFFWGGVYAPGASTHDPIEILLNTEDEEERDRLTELWRDNRLNELSFVGVVAALLAGVLTSTGSWPAILPNGKISPWPVRTTWYCGIVLSVFALLSAADQTVRLYRLSSHRDGRVQIRELLSKSKGKPRNGRSRPSMAQLYTWQMPVMFLTTATICMIVGLFLHVWSAIRRLDHEHWWSDDAKVAVAFSVVGTISIVAFFAGQVTLYIS